MASTDARPIPQKNVAYRVTFPIMDADGDLVTAASTPDSEISKDGGTFADCTNEATEIATSSGMYFLDLTSTEMNADTVAIIVKTATAGAKTVPIVLYPEEAGDIRVNLTQILDTAVSTPATAGILDVNVKNIDNDAASASGTVTFPNATLASTTNITAGTVTTATNVTTVNGLAAGVVTTAAINDGAFTAAKFAAGAFDAVWSVAARLLTAGTNIVLAKGVGVTGFNDLSTAQVNTEADLALADVGLTTTITGRIDAAITTRLATGGYAVPPTAIENADALLDRNMATGTDSGSPTVRTVRQALRFSRNKWSLSGSTLTVTKEDDATASWTSTVTTTVGADPITANDPAGP